MQELDFQAVFLNRPSSWANHVPLMLLANEVHATRAFICDQAAAGNNVAMRRLQTEKY
jgi:hypothetical protein